MNQYLTKAVDRYQGLVDEKVLINPISKQDANIIAEIIKIFFKMGWIEIVNILKEYKYKADREIVKDLIEWNSKNSFDPESTIPPEVAAQINAAQEYNKYVQLKGIRFQAKFIISYEPDDVEILKEGGSSGTRFDIILNRSDENVKKLPTYANMKISFSDMEERDNALLKIDEIVQRGAKFINLDK